MILEDYRTHLKEQLASLYPKEEVDSISSLVFEYVLGMNKVEVALSRKLKLSQVHLKALNDVFERLLLAEPIQYIIGTTEFYGLEFQVNKATLIPRPETEELVAWILDELKKSSLENPIILDIGTGSGCIPVALAKHLPSATIEAVDISMQALETANTNAANNNVGVTFFQQDILAVKHLPKVYDILVSNPPYVRDLEKAEINDNVLKHEPHSALFVDDNDPLVFYHKIAQLAADNLEPHGQLFFEINQYLGEETVALLKDIGFTQVELRKDMFGADRMIRAIK